LSFFAKQPTFFAWTHARYTVAGADQTLLEMRLKFDTALETHFGSTLREPQVAAAQRLLRRSVVEMQTGEGKTFTTAFAAAVWVALGHHVKIATANPYLAHRDARSMESVFRSLQMSSGSIDSAETFQASPPQIIYGTIRQFGFDYLVRGIAARKQRSRLLTTPVASEFDVLIVDEADSVLIDEAQTPMVITAPQSVFSQGEQTLFRWAADASADLSRPQDYDLYQRESMIALTPRGRRLVWSMALPPEMNDCSTTDILHAVERALFVRHRFIRDHHYAILDGGIAIVDEYTGRISRGRMMSGGIHQALEAKEGLALTPATQTVARMTVQEFASQFRHVCGLTATAYEDRRELQAVFGLRVCRVPTFRPVHRQSLATVVCKTQDEKWLRIADDARRVIHDGRAVLIGTRTVRQSETLSRVLREIGIDHQCLNALNPQQEASIIAAAGQSRQVTVATNMAGRGTDIVLANEVRARGGLHVIVSELHASPRIDRQLMGRCGRQGDPGTTRLFVSAEDEILSLALGHEVAQSIASQYTRVRSDRWLLRQLLAAQKNLGRRQRDQRVQVTTHARQVAQAMRVLGRDPHFDPIPEEP